MTRHRRAPTRAPSGCTPRGSRCLNSNPNPNRGLTLTRTLTRTLTKAMNTEPEWPETNAMGTIGWRREPITAAAIQASALASKARLWPTCQTCNPTCQSLQPHLPEPARHVLEPATPRARAYTPLCSRACTPHAHVLLCQVLGTKWSKSP